MALKTKILFFILSIAGPLLLAQNLPEAIQTKITTDPNQIGQEKIFVHTDRAVYLTGETFWFKIYLLNAQSYRPSTLSKVAYLEILDVGNVPILQTKVEIENGVGYGSLFIPATINSGNYRASAYTQWMRNKGPDSFFYCDVTLINPFKKILKSKPSTQVVFDTQFLPEGGNLVEGLPSRVAVRAVNEQGLGINYKGIVVTDQDTIATFQSIRFGFSSFQFTPQNKTYRAYIKPENEKWKEVPFPVRQPQGVTLQVVTKNNQLEIKLHSKNERNKNYYLVAHQRGKIKTSIRLSGTTLLQAILPIDTLSFGVNTLTIFDMDFEPVCERFYFRKPANKPRMDLQLSDSRAANRSKVQVTLSTIGQSDKINLSVAVYQEDSIGQFKKQQIDHYLLLTSDLRGTIESPEYYFLNNHEESNQLLDMMMLTHGWSRFTGKNSDDYSQKSVFVPEFRGHLVRGRITDQLKNPANGITTYLASPSKNIRLYPSVSNRLGEVKFEMKNFRGSKKIILQTDFQKDSTYQLEIISPFSEVHTQGIKHSISISPAIAPSLIQRSVAMQANSIYNEAPSQEYKSDSITFYGKPDEQYKLDDYTRFPVLEEVLREYVTGVWVRKKEGKFVFQMPDKVEGYMLDGSPLAILDGVPMFSTNRLLELDALKIKEIDVIGKKYYLNGITFNGIVSFKTYRGDLGGLVIDSKALTLDYEGMQTRKEFYAPLYDSPNQVKSRIPDRRTLLLWKPDLTFDSRGKSTFDFFTSDIKGLFTLEAQGMDDHGNPITIFRELKVK